MATATSSDKFSSYSEVAREYYDSKRHPTCANFREGSAAILSGWFRRYVRSGSIIVETGAGASIVREIVDELSTRIFLALCDKSAEMLNRPDNRLANVCFVADVEKLPLPKVSVDLVVASLGDPYNTTGFWKECRRILRPNGQIFFTTPSFEWAHAFREETHAPQMQAQFDLADGRSIFVPSFVFVPANQRELICSAGLELREEVHIERDAIPAGKRSAKLRPGRIVSGYRALCGY